MLSCPYNFNTRCGALVALFLSCASVSNRDNIHPESRRARASLPKIPLGQPGRQRAATGGIGSIGGKSRRRRSPTRLHPDQSAGDRSVSGHFARRDRTTCGHVAHRTIPRPSGRATRGGWETSKPEGFLDELWWKESKHQFDDLNLPFCLAHHPYRNRPPPFRSRRQHTHI
jgi:hypothetical protein